MQHILAQPQVALQRFSQQQISKLFLFGICLCLFGALPLGLSGASSDGSVVAWGGNESGQTNPCAQNVISIAAGYHHSLLLKSDRTVAACGTYTSAYPITIPADLGNVVAIAAGWDHDVALLADGTVRAWGLGELATNVPQGLTNVIAIAASQFHSLALKKDGTVVGWGSMPAPVPVGLTNVVAISAGTGDLALKGDGTVVGWGMSTTALSQITNAVCISSGWNDRFVLKADESIDVEGWWGGVPAGLGNIETIAASPGTDHHVNLALLRDGTVRGWGHNFYRIIGIPMVLPGLSGVVAVAPGVGHSVVLIGGGPPFITAQPVSRTVVMSGETYFRVQATGAYPLSYQWKLQGIDVPGATRSLLILTNLQPDQAGEYTVRVRNGFGEESSAIASLYLAPLQIDRQPQSQARAVGDSISFDVMVRGIEPLHYQWRHNGTDIPGGTERNLRLDALADSDSGGYGVIITNDYGQVLSATAQLTIFPVLITDQPKDQVSYRGGNASFSVTCNGITPITYQWLHNGSPLTGANSATLEFSDLRAEQAGAYSVLVGNLVGQVESSPAMLHLPVIVAWGDLTQSNVPPYLTNVLAIASGSYVNEALTSDRHVIAWDGLWHSSDTNVPPDATNIAAISIGGYYNNRLAIRSDGTIVRLSDNSQPFPGVTNLVTAADGGALVGLYADGTLVASGFPSPAPPNLSNLVAVSVGYAHGLALHSDGKAAAWGAGSPESPPDPWGSNRGQATVPPDATNVIAISAYYMNSMALRSDGTVVAWGDNWQGQTNVPPGLSNVVRIAAGEYHSMALKSDGTVVVWGDNWAGQTNIPSGLTNVIAIAAGGRHCLALLGDAPPALHARAFDPVFNDDTFSLSIPTESGRVYRLEQNSSPLTDDWTFFLLKLGSGEPIKLTDPAPFPEKRFYRTRDW